MMAVANGTKGPSGSNVHLLITAFDYDRNRATFFRSAVAGTGGAWGSGAPLPVTLADAIHASTNAPVNYFDAPAAFFENADRYWDGAITGCNNPVLAAVTEAVVLGQDSLNIVVLSLGTGLGLLPLAEPDTSPQTPYEAPRVESSLATDLKKLAGSILDDPPDAATFIAHVMTKGASGLSKPVESRIVRMNPLISPIKVGDKWTAPQGITAAQFQHLYNLELDALEQHDVLTISHYCDLWLEDKASNQPIRMDGSTLKAEIGYTKFSEARAAWKALTTTSPSSTASLGQGKEASSKMSRRKQPKSQRKNR